ncbi:MAG: hypothetical protein ACERKN_21450 [Velocimicrobium sp.]
MHNQMKDTQHKEKTAQNKSLNLFNAITKSVKPKNQNQAHNVKKEGTGRLNQMK